MGEETKWEWITVSCSVHHSGVIGDTCMPNIANIVMYLNFILLFYTYNIRAGMH